MISKKGRMFVRAVKFKDHTHINTQQDERYEHMNHTGTVTWIHIQSFVCDLRRLPVCGHSTTLQSIRIKWGETYWTTNRIETKFPFACRQFAVVPFLAEWKPLSFTENLCAVPTLFSAIHLHAAVVVHRISLLNDVHGKSMNLLETEQRELQSIDKQPISGSRENRSRISRLTRYIQRVQWRRCWKFGLFRSSFFLLLDSCSNAVSLTLFQSSFAFLSSI